MKVINSLIKRISMETKDSQSIFILDEVFGKNALGETNVKCDWSGLTFYQNVDVIMAVNPQGIEFNKRFEMILPKNENTFSKRLVGKHRNCQSISELLEHYKALYKNNSYLDSSADMESDVLPPGNLPIWIQRENTESHYDILEYIKDNFTSSYSVTLLYHSSISYIEHISISQWCKENNWRFIEAEKVVGSEDQFVITYNFAPGPEHISRARNGLVMVTTKGYTFCFQIQISLNTKSSVN